METGKKVSIILPNYNGAKYLKNAIDSVLRQTYRNYEFIIVDDCSTDNSRDIISSYDDQRIVKCFEDKNRHVAYTVNKGFRIASGEYIARIDSDDVWDSTKLEKQVEFMERNQEYGACFTKVHIIDEFGEIADDKYDALVKSYNNNGNRSQGEWAKFFLQKGNCLCNPSVLMRRDALEKIGKYYNIAYIPGQDFELWTRMVIKYPIYILDEKLTFYRWTEEESKISGMDDESAHAFFNVHMLVRHNYLDKMSEDEFRELFGDEFRNKQSRTKEELECEKAYLLLDCVKDAPNINFLGMIRFEKILNTLGGLDILEKEFQMSLKNFYKNYRTNNFANAVVNEKLESKKREADYLKEIIKLKESIICNEEKELERQKDQLKRLQDELTAVYNSKSWKMTYPLRRFKEKLNSLME